ncbi:MAG: hypothetical protein IJR85_09200 [Synergistaceae bacterium]|nr:hypothetical protein [Synergistaceae bacterium]
MSRVLEKTLTLLREHRYKDLLHKAKQFLHRKLYLSLKYPLLLWIMEHDSRFNVSNNYLPGILRAAPVRKYELAKIKLCNIKRQWDDMIMSLEDTATFGFIVGGDEKRYREYVRAVYERMNMDASIIPGNIDKNVAGVQKTIASLTQNGYDMHKGIVVLDERNVMIDGLHRSSILWKQFGGTHEITVLRIFYCR